MVARDFTELACWQLSRELKVRIYAFTAKEEVKKDFKFCDQIRESARSVPSNIAEGFGKYHPPEFKRYLNIAAGSLVETRNHLRDALDLGYIDQEEFREMEQLAKRARGAILALIQYLNSCPRKWPPEEPIPAHFVEPE